MYIFAIVLGAAILGLIIYRNWKQQSQLTSEGKIIDRNRHFIEQAENFTLVCDNHNRVVSGVQSLAYSEMKISMTMDAQNQAFRFTYMTAMGSWNALLYRMGAPDRRMTYRFQFTNWKTSDYGVIGEVQMNMLLTAIEKMFLSIDPNTQVQTSLLETKTKHKFF